ncbi:MAG TPA: YraN family protein [Steroidobacteraceae bacterium]|nr:YraN family protein [Steroidobacteraceae bacterium]
MSAGGLQASGRATRDPREAGRAAEDTAAAFLSSQGARILLRNYRRRAGELDIVALCAGVLVIAEVRTRASSAYGGAAASVDARKQRRVVRAAQQLLQQHREYARLPVRFDVVVVSGPAVEWIRHAFEA